MPRSEDPIDRVIRDARHVLDCLDHGYLPPDYVESECFARLRRSLEAHRLAGMAESVAASLPSKHPDHSEQEAAAA